MVASQQERPVTEGPDLEVIVIDVLDGLIRFRP
jgi:hypothetical protein